MSSFKVPVSGVVERLIGSEDACGGTDNPVSIDRATKGCVHVVIPVFNRWQFTQQCVEDLRRQTYRHLTINVSDGGSTDGTRDKLARLYPDVEVIYDGKERWWAGSCALAIERILAKAATDDFVLLLNNDTRVPENYIETLVAWSRTHDAAVGAKVVDSRDPTRVLDAGEMIDWERYDFPIKTEIASGERHCEDVDTLPGRGTLIPIKMIRAVGNIDDRTFPHYISDYDFFCRIKSAGFKLLVCYDTMILAHIEETGIVPQAQLTLRQAWREIFDRRSMTNLGDHWRFVSRHAPALLRPRLHRLLVAQAAAKLLLRTELGIFFLPPYKGARLVRRVARAVVRLINEPDAALEFAHWPHAVKLVALMTFAPRPFQGDEAAAKGLDVSRLVRDGVLILRLPPDWYCFGTLQWAGRSDAAQLNDLLRACRGPSLLQYRALVSYKRARQAHIRLGDDSAADPGQASCNH
ncbi:MULTISPECIES: glycosyltransferase family 2 protein [unclassified Bradyrhizobium]|uniref:glycosyltransferase family 2 protein n=1 Tax=unclassified Bradyrhizobium TaxID=2631580 RepID=UPI0028E97619|nr:MULTISPECIES: glycosyltransferase family 2 protein [unclassified Bradyrhizobium]